MARAATPSSVTGTRPGPIPGQSPLRHAADQDVLEELAGAAARAAVHMARQALLELEARRLEQLRVEPARVVDDDHDGRARLELPGRVREHLDHALDVRAQRPLRGAAS